MKTTRAKTARTKTTPRPPAWGLAEQLRDAIGEDGRTAYALGQAAGLDPGVIQRFLNRERGLTLDSACAIAGALGLRLASVGGRRGKTARPAPPPAPLEAAGPIAEADA